jgi:PhoPQ-activated pathogenicity-related protein
VVLAILALGVNCQDYPDFEWDNPNALDEYVNRDDGAWEWTHLATYRYRDVSVVMVNMTSQRWLDDDTVDHSLWWHWMGIAIPDNIDHPEHAMVISVGGGNGNKEDYPGRAALENVVASSMANDTGMIVAYVMQQPNGRIKFYDDPEDKGRSGDDLIAYSWVWFLEKFKAGMEPREEAILRFPMTKAAKRGFDTVIEVAEWFRPGETDVKFCISSGASKRGWTAWSHAYTDQRVVATIPIVFSLLKVRECMMAHYRALEGHWSFAMRPYYQNNVTQFIIDDDADEVLQYEDPWYYRSRLALIPKLVISAVGDEYFFPQDHHRWWAELEGPKWLMMNPNAEHILFPQWLKVYSTMAGWVNTLLNSGVEALPVVSWEKEDDQEEEKGKVTMEASWAADSVRGMRAVTLDNSTYRDFRLIAGYPDPGPNPVIWRERNVTIQDDPEESEIVYEMEVDYVEDEWVGFMVEGIWASDEGFDMYFTSEAHIVPDTFPAEACTTPEECYSSLV